MECVKLLVANHQGIDKNGERCSALYLQSNLGYTALHLAALDCPPWGVREITYLLLLSFTDYSALSVDGRTAIEIAHDEKNQTFIDLYNNFTAPIMDAALHERVNHSRHTLKSKYTYRMPEIPKKLKTKFELPPPDEDDPEDNEMGPKMRHSKRVPAQMLIPEHEVLPLVSHGDTNMRGLQALKCMKFAIDQAEKNADRRLALVNKFNNSVEALDVQKYIT